MWGMEHMAIVVDGTSQPVRAGELDFPAARVARYRPLGGVLIAVVTAIVTAGAMGPAAPAAGDTGSAAAVTCPAPVSLNATASSAPGPLSTALAGRVVAWWTLPGPSRWVDPATGRTVQLDRAAAPAVVDHRARDR